MQTDQIPLQSGQTWTWLSFIPTFSENRQPRDMPSSINKLHKGEPKDNCDDVSAKRQPAVHGLLEKQHPQSINVSQTGPWRPICCLKSCPLRCPTRFPAAVQHLKRHIGPPGRQFVIMYKGTHSIRRTQPELTCRVCGKWFQSWIFMNVCVNEDKRITTSSAERAWAQAPFF